MPCNSEYLCDAKCPVMRQCGRHQCKRKVCFSVCLSVCLCKLLLISCSAVTVAVRHVNRYVGGVSVAGTTSVLHLVTAVSKIRGGRARKGKGEVCFGCGHLLYFSLSLSCIFPATPGRCYPCILTAEINCACKSTTITVPCGREKITKPPKCREMCR